MSTEGSSATAGGEDVLLGQENQNPVSKHKVRTRRSEMPR